MHGPNSLDPGRQIVRKFGLSGAMPARAALVLVTALWGSTFVVLQSGLSHLAPLVLVAARFGLAAVAVKLLFRRAGLVPAAVGLAIANFVAMSLQTIGLKSTTPSRSAFITALSVVLVPVLYPLFGRALPRARSLLAAAVALVGVYVLFRPIGNQWRSGDTLTVVAAAVFALYILELGRLSRRHPVMSLVFTQCVVTAGLAAVAAPFHGLKVSVGWPAVGVVVYLGLVCTVVTYSLMAWGQARIEPAVAAIIYTLEPVFAAGLSVAIGREAMAVPLAVGGSLILAGMLLSGGEPDPSP